MLFVFAIRHNTICYNFFACYVISRIASNLHSMGDHDRIMMWTPHVHASRILLIERREKKIILVYQNFMHSKDKNITRDEPAEFIS